MNPSEIHRDETAGAEARVRRATSLARNMAEALERPEANAAAGLGPSAAAAPSPEPATLVAR